MKFEKRKKKFRGEEIRPVWTHVQFNFQVAGSVGLVKMRRTDLLRLHSFDVTDFTSSTIRKLLQFS